MYAIKALKNAAKIPGTLPEEQQVAARNGIQTRTAKRSVLISLSEREEQQR